MSFVPKNGDALLPTPTILLVEDNPVIKRIVQHLLGSRNYQVIVAADGQEGIQQALTHQPDMVLLDMVLPDLNGIEVCRQLKAQPETADIPIIFMTSVSDTEHKVQAFEMGAVDYITKPIQGAELLARINTHLTLRNLQKGLEQEIEERGKLIADLEAFAHMVAHDLKSPLGSVMGFAEVLQANFDDLSAQARTDAMNYILKAGHTMNAIIDSLLLLASVRLDAVHLEPLHMEKIITSVQARLAPMISKYQAEITVAETWPTAMGHALWIEEVWVNYLSNGLKYGGQPPRLELGFTSLPEGWIEFWVADNGQGLTPEQQSQLFKPFARLSEHVDLDGHGLGLSIVQRIVEKLSGQVGVESQVGHGSRFYFTLPVV